MSIASPAQPLPRRATTVAALLAYPVFFHGQRVVVRGDLVVRDEMVWLVREAGRLLCLGARPAGLEGRDVEVSGTFWDAGRLDPGDARLAGHDLSRIAEQLLGKPWPGVGELPVLVVEAMEPAMPPTAPSVRAIALQPERFLGQQVTVQGRFRGRNLYGDLPQAPGRSRWDFVLQAADAAIWVSGLEPRGRDFRLDVEARVDTSRWLEVTGVVRYERGLVRLEGTRVALAEPPREAPSAAVALPPVKGPPPEVIFSTPTPDDVDVPRGTAVRVQFSRDMDAGSFTGRVRVSYVASGVGATAAGPIEFTATYHDGPRALEIRFRQPLEPYRTVKVELLPGIAAHDGVAMEQPWILTFTVGG